MLSTDRSKVNYVVNFLAFLSFVISALSGLAIKFFMPSGVRQGKFQEFFGIEKSVWSGIHEWFGILLVILVVIHLVLHWNWIVCMTKSFFQTDKCDE